MSTPVETIESPEPDTLTTACPNCGKYIRSSYCAHCGEQRFDEHSLALRHFLGHALEGLLHFDSKIGRSLQTLVLKPGKLTLDYICGKRKPYLGPVQMFF